MVLTINILLEIVIRNVYIIIHLCELECQEENSFLHYAVRFYMIARAQAHIRKQDIQFPRRAETAELAALDFLPASYLITCFPERF